MIPSKIDLLMRYNFGGSPGRPPSPPKIPTPADAAKNVDSGISRKPRGYQSTILGGAKTANAESTNPVKILLGL